MSTTLALSLVSHTNAGKTTLARTLLRRDVGEVRDAPHVTEFTEDHLLLRSEAGDELRLWDTPGFGDTVRLVRRMRREGSPLGWLLSEVWDRWRDRPFWASQQALRHVRDRSDVVLYLVNVAESPEAAGYVDPEMELLAWMGKPVLVLLNQLGTPRPAAEEAADLTRWRSHLARYPQVAGLLPMDAFARCWVQEAALLQAVATVVSVPAQQQAMQQLQAAWARQRLATFERAVAALALTLARIGAARVAVDGAAGLSEAVRRLAGRLGRWFGAGDTASDDATSQAQRALAALLDEEVRAGTAELIALHGLDGRAQGEILARVASQIERSERFDEGRSALLGGLVSGALSGLTADIASGGLTLGGGLLAGGILGALGAAGLARGVNVMRGGGPAWVGWRAEAMGAFTEAALLRYLAVAHFGRGRGQWAEGEAPPHWRAVVSAALAPHQAALQALWRGRATAFDAPGEADRLAAQLQPVLAAAAREALVALYPGAWPAAPVPPAPSPPPDGEAVPRPGA